MYFITGIRSHNADQCLINLHEFAIFNGLILQKWYSEFDKDSSWSWYQSQQATIYIVLSHDTWSAFFCPAWFLGILAIIFQKIMNLMLPFIQVWDIYSRAHTTISGLWNKIWNLQDQTQFWQNLYMIKKESLPDRPQFCQSGSAVWQPFWRLL